MKLSGKSLLVFVVVAITVFTSGCSKERVQPTKSTQSTVASQSRSKGKPKIVALETQHDFGKVKQGTTLQHVFRIRNQGDQRLVIERASGSWGCTATLVSTKAVPPGGETQVKATVSTKNRNGHLNKTVSVHSNDPETPRLTLVLEAEITTDLIVTPYSINFGQQAKGEKAEREITIRSSDPERIRIVSTRIKDKRFTIKPKSKEAGAELYTVRFLGSPTLERIAAAIEVEYQGAEETSMRIPIAAMVIGDLVYSKHLFFNKQDGAFSPREVTFSSRSSKPFRLISARDPAGLLKFTIAAPSGPRATLRVEVANPDASYVSPKRGVFTVNTNRRDENRIEINYSIMERRVASPARLIKPATPKPVQPPLR